MFLKKCLLIFFIGLFVFSLNAQENTSGAAISDIKVTGLKRTKPAHIEEVLGGLRGKPASVVNAKYIESILQSDGLFSEIKVEVVDGNGTVISSAGEITPDKNTASSSDAGTPEASGVPYIRIQVKEKVTFMAVPFGMYSNDGFMGGFMLMDMNAFGMKNVINAGGIFSESKLMGIAGFSKPALSGKRPGFSLFTSLSRNDSEFARLDNSTYMKFKDTKYNFSGNLNYAFRNGIKISAGGKYMYQDFDNNIFDKFHSGEGNFNVAYSLNDWNGVFLSTSSFSTFMAVGSSTYGKVFERTGFSVIIQRPIVKYVRFRVSNCFSLQHDVPFPTLQGRQSVGVSILPNNFGSPKMLGLTGSIEGAVVKTKMLTISIYGTYECVDVENYDRSMDFSHGFNAGTRVYLSKLAFPAMSFGYAYNVTHRTAFFSFSAGMDF